MICYHPEQLNHWFIPGHLWMREHKPIQWWAVVVYGAVATNDVTNLC